MEDNIQLTAGRPATQVPQWQVDLDRVGPCAGYSSPASGTVATGGSCCSVPCC